MPWVDISEAAFTLGVSERTVRNWIKSGKLQARNAGGRREVEIPEPESGQSAHVFADDEGEEGQSIEVQKRLEVALIECGRVKGTLASQERMMESLSANIAELNAKLQRSERVIGRRTVWCVIVAFLGVGAYSLSRSYYTSDLQTRTTEHKNEIIRLKDEQLEKLEKKDGDHEKAMSELRKDKDKERLDALSEQANALRQSHKQEMDRVKDELGRRISQLEEQTHNLRQELDREKTSRMKSETERDGLKKELENAEARQAETERLVELQKKRLEEVEKSRAELEEELGQWRAKYKRL